jgi:hypothetical protein
MELSPLLTDIEIQEFCDDSADSIAAARWHDCGVVRQRGNARPGFKVPITLTQYPSRRNANTMHTIAVEVIRMTSTGRSKKP